MGERRRDPNARPVQPFKHSARNDEQRNREDHELCILWINQLLKHQPVFASVSHHDYCITDWKLDEAANWKRGPRDLFIWVEKFRLGNEWSLAWIQEFKSACNKNAMQKKKKREVTIFDDRERVGKQTAAHDKFFGFIAETSVHAKIRRTANFICSLFQPLIEIHFSKNPSTEAVIAFSCLLGRSSDSSYDCSLVAADQPARYIQVVKWSASEWHVKVLLWNRKKEREIGINSVFYTVLSLRKTDLCVREGRKWSTERNERKDPTDEVALSFVVHAKSLLSYFLSPFPLFITSSSRPSITLFPPSSFIILVAGIAAPSRNTGVWLQQHPYCYFISPLA